MKKSVWVSAVCLLFTLFLAQSAFTQWQTFESEEHNVQFQIPAGWTTESSEMNGIPELVAESAEGTMAMYVFSYKDATISTDELFDQTVADLDFESKGDSWEENINGFMCVVGEGSGKIEGEKVGMFIMAATYNEDNHVAYIFTEYSKFDKNAEVMNQILDSFAPLFED